MILNSFSGNKGVLMVSIQSIFLFKKQENGQRNFSKNNS